MLGWLIKFETQLSPLYELHVHEMPAISRQYGGIAPSVLICCKNSQHFTGNKLNGMNDGKKVIN